MWKKHKAKIIVTIAVIAVLVAAFFMGGDLGNTEKEAEIALKKVDKEESVENIIKSCLKVLMG